MQNFTRDNRIAEKLKRHLPAYLRTDETIYQEAKRIVVAEMQNIVYGEYLQPIIDPSFTGKPSFKKNFNKKEFYSLTGF